MDILICLKHNQIFYHRKINIFLVFIEKLKHLILLSAVFIELIPKRTDFMQLIVKHTELLQARGSRKRNVKTSNNTNLISIYNIKQ